MIRRECVYQARQPNGWLWPDEPTEGWTGFAEATFCAFTGHIRETEAEALADVRAIPDSLLLTDEQYERLSR